MRTKHVHRAQESHREKCLHEILPKAMFMYFWRLKLKSRIELQKSLNNMNDHIGIVIMVDRRDRFKRDVIESAAQSEFEVPDVLKAYLISAEGRLCVHSNPSSRSCNSSVAFLATISS